MDEREGRDRGLPGTARGPAKPEAAAGIPTGDAITGDPGAGVANPAGTATGIGGSGGDSRGGPESAGGIGRAKAALGGSGGEGPAADVTAGGPATPAGGRTDGIGSTGVTGMGSSAMGHPSDATAGDTGGRDIPPSVSERAQGVTSQREVGIMGDAGLAREAALPDSGAGPSLQTGAQGSGSTTDVPGGREILGHGAGTTGGTPGTGIGGTNTPPAPEVQAGIRGAGARDAGRKDEA
ncbi:hypothetical protein [Arenibaculum pallidiluteum]|uniref:hypothetical protein n=1 Tax=Arenibaculum pallidiluteum TaxID=2812559 RepID=UPI001A96106B|nr:hypothetical protein [Arenibaculum pallidiluteum]